MPRNNSEGGLSHPEQDNQQLLSDMNRIYSHIHTIVTENPGVLIHIPEFQVHSSVLRRFLHIPSDELLTLQKMLSSLPSFTVQRSEYTSTSETTPHLTPPQTQALKEATYGFTQRVLPEEDQLVIRERMDQWEKVGKIWLYAEQHYQTADSLFGIHLFSY